MVTVTPEVRAQLVAHASEEAPNEACGIIVFRDGESVRYERGKNLKASPKVYELEIDPEVWFLEDEGFELAIFHSHPVTEARPSPTDIANVGLWEGRPYFILGLAVDDLAAFTIKDGEVERLQTG
ncbi:MAG: [CysO sulfur-carrier protein]-S-L-cysteine hydrolase [Gaiellaceae bacterium]|nr:[CysO sulfur-carrier protein]-S-L-cysteine hydrolase [Gaiellaceae bacterium]